MKSGPKLVYDTTQSPPGSLCVPLTLDASVELDFPGVTFKEGPATLYSKNIKCVNWGGGSGEVEETDDGETTEWEGGGGGEPTAREIEEQTEKILGEVEEHEGEGEVEWGELVGGGGEEVEPPDDLHPLHWQGNVKMSFHKTFDVPESSSHEEHGTASWQVNGYTEEGNNLEEWFGRPAYYHLAYPEASWHTQFEETVPLDCGAYHREGEGSGEGPSERYEVSGTWLALSFGPQSYTGGFEFEFGTPLGIWNYRESGSCFGGFTSSETLVGRFTGGQGCGGWSTSPLPRNGTEIVGNLSGTGCGAPGDGEYETSTWTLRFNLTVTCPGGGAPDADWMCPG